MSAPLDLGGILAAGGEGRVALLRYCAMSMTMEPLFVFLVREYRLRPTRAAALALYDVFCAPEAPARLGALELLPPRDLRLAAATRTLRQQQAQLESREPLAEGTTVPVTTPPRNLFDILAQALESDGQSRYAQAGSQYDPRYPPEHSLPGGRMSAVQRHFVDKVWRPVVRPRLVAAGFWQIAVIE